MSIAPSPSWCRIHTCFWLSKPGVATGHPWLQVHDFLPWKKIVARDAYCLESVASRATQRSQYLCVRDNVSLFVHQSQDWNRKIAEPGRSTCVQTARLEYMKRFGIAEMLSYILIAGAGIRLGCRSSPKHEVL